MVSILARAAVGAAWPSSSAMAASVWCPIGVRLSVISGWDVSARPRVALDRAVAAGAGAGAREVRDGGRDGLRRSGSRIAGSGRGVRLCSGFPNLPANGNAPQSAVSHARAHPCNNWLTKIWTR
jgi:hypothetical protein